MNVAHFHVLFGHCHHFISSDSMCLHFLTNRSFSVYDLLCECHSFMGKIGISRKFDILEIYLIHQYLGQMHFAENEPRD